MNELTIREKIKFLGVDLRKLEKMRDEIISEYGADQTEENHTRLVSGYNKVLRRISYVQVDLMKLKIGEIHGDNYRDYGVGKW